MLFSNHWPYVNFHDLNLDWVIEKLKEVIGIAETAEEVANSVKATAEAAQSAAEAAQSAADTASATANSAANTATAASATADSAKKVAEGIADTAQNAVDVANATATSVQEAIDTANAASASANAISDKVDAAVATANQANTNANAAVNTANSANTTANGIADTANSALATSNTAISAAGTANTTAAAANTTAAAAQTTANNARYCAWGTIIFSETAGTIADSFLPEAGTAVCSYYAPSAITSACTINGTDYSCKTAGTNDDADVAADSRGICTLDIDNKIVNFKLGSSAILSGNYYLVKDRSPDKATALTLVQGSGTVKFTERDVTLYTIKSGSNRRIVLYDPLTNSIVSSVSLSSNTGVFPGYITPESWDVSDFKGRKLQIGISIYTSSTGLDNIAVFEPIVKIATGTIYFSGNIGEYYVSLYTLY